MLVAKYSCPALATTIFLQPEQSTKMNEALEKLIALAYRPHYNCEGDTWYGCPKSVDGCADDSQGSDCNCGADKHNEQVDALAKGLRSEAAPKIHALKSGGDWNDASMAHVVLPEGVDIDEAHAEWRAWYATEYLPVRVDSPVYMDFGEFLHKRKGARWPTKEELTVFDEY